MANFKQKILNTLKNNKNTDNTLNYLSNVQNNLIKNYSNPVFTNSDKNKLLEKYGKIQNLGKAIYKHNALKENNFNAQKEEENVSNLVLKGGISNCKYVWHSENSEHTCEECASLDGTEYSFEDEVPERPHPNCQCWVEIIENDDENSDTDEEPCDCWEQIAGLVADVEGLESEIISDICECDSMQTEVEEMLFEVQKFREQIVEAKNELSKIESCGPNCGVLTGMAIDITDDSKLEEIVENLIENNKTAKEVYAIFEDEKHKMEELQDGLDKYHHANANCTSAEKSEAHARWAVIFSIFKEIKDYCVKVFIEKKDAYKIFVDCMNDLRADWYGIQKAKESGCCSEKVKDVYDVLEK